MTYLWVIAYDVPATHDKWRDWLAKKLSNFGFFRVQFSVFIGQATTGRTTACKNYVESVLQANSVPADVRFYPLCKSCELKSMHFNILHYIPGTKGGRVPGNILVK